MQNEVNPFGAGLRQVLGVLVLAAAAMMATFPGRCEEPAALFSKEPYIQMPAPDTVVVMWESLTNLSGAVRFGPGDSLGQTVEDVRPRALESKTSASSAETTSASASQVFYVYEARLTELQPGTVYSYTVELGGARTRTHHFKTFTPGAGAVRFIVYGDSRSDPQAHATMARRFRQHAPEFILHTGDLVARGRNYGLWAKEFFQPMAPVIDEVPFFSVMGNHEDDGTNYLAYFHLPGKKLWYSLDIGPVHVLALDFRFPQSRSEQFRFASNDLVTAHAPWKIVVLHTPMFNIGGHASAWGHTNYLPVFHRAKVDLVLSGHSHIYERFRPLAPRTEKDWAITHVTTGGGGANLHLSFDHPALVVRETARHYMAFEATREKLRAEAIRVDGSLLDRFELTKTNGNLPPEYLGQVYPEELLELFYDAVPSLASRAASVPTTNQPARVLLSPVPRKGLASPPDLEISLAPMSAPYYEIQKGTLRATTPGAAQTNLLLWVSVHASGKKKITADRDGQLVPPLVFMAKVTSAAGDTLAYGTQCRVSKPVSELWKKTQERIK